MHYFDRRYPRVTARRAPERHPAGLRLSLTLVLAGALLVLGAIVGAAARAATHPASPDPAFARAQAASPAPPLATTSARRSQSPAAVVPPPEDLGDLPAWLDYRARNHLAALPLEARIFYRRGLVSAQNGDFEEAVRLVRGAAELDPAFVTPHLTLASWLLLREPSQALLQYASVIELGRQDFLLQLALAGNALYLAFQALFLGLLAAALIVVGLRNRELRHACSERIARFTSPTTARWWAWAILLLPFATGFGIALPTLVLLGLLWPLLRAPERAVFVGLLAVMLAAPWTVTTLDRLGLPLRDGQPPFHSVPLVVTESPTTGRPQELAALAARDPGNPFLQFAAAWTARRDGDLRGAEAGYRRALELWPDDDRTLNNLGNVLAMEGRSDEALESYRRAAAVNPSNAPAAFNASQIYTQRFDYHAATDALSHASALNFELVKNYQSQSGDDGVLPLVDEWIAPRSFWKALAHEPAALPVRGALPPAWRSHIESSGWPFSGAAVLLALLAIFLGARMQRSVPLRTCSNCGAIVCRRCACRRRETAFCPACAAVEGRAETPDFGRVLLLQHRRQVCQSRRLLRTALATLIPGYGLLSFRRVLPAVLLLSGSAALVALGASFGAPFSFETRIAVPAQEVPLAVLVGLWVAVYAASIFGYLASVVRADAEEAALTAPVRSRIRLSSHDHTSLAA